MSGRRNCRASSRRKSSTKRRSRFGHCLKNRGSPGQGRIIFAFHGYPWLIHRLTYRRTNHKNLHVRGYKEEGTTTTPFDMVVLNELDRCHLIMDLIDRLPQLGARAAYFKQAIHNKLNDHKEYICKHGDDMPEIAGWRWGQQVKAGGPRVDDTGADNV